MDGDGVGVKGGREDSDIGVCCGIALLVILVGDSLEPSDSHNNLNSRRNSPRREVAFLRFSVSLNNVAENKDKSFTFSASDEGGVSSDSRRRFNSTWMATWSSAAVKT